MADIKIERKLDNNGRLVETHTYEVITDGKKERVIETHVEQVPMAISERIVEEVTPVVTTRRKEVYKDGKVIDTVVEDLNRTLTTVKENPSVVDLEQLVKSLREVQTSAPTGKATSELVTLTSNNAVWEYVEMGAYVVLSAELAFCLYHLLLKNWF